jgi:hypothetical protein
MIDSYSFGRMVIDGREYKKDLMIKTDGGIISPWWRLTGHELVPADIEELVSTKPSILIVGSGAYGVMKPAPELKERLESMGIRTVVLPTGQAVERYNSLWGQESGVAACFHLTC